MTPCPEGRFSVFTPRIFRGCPSRPPPPGQIRFFRFLHAFPLLRRELREVGIPRQHPFFHVFRRPFRPSLFENAHGKFPFLSGFMIPHFSPFVNSGTCPPGQWCESQHGAKVTFEGSRSHKRGPARRPGRQHGAAAPKNPASRVQKKFFTGKRAAEATSRGRAPKQPRGGTPHPVPSSQVRRAGPLAPPNISSAAPAARARPGAAATPAAEPKILSCAERT